MGTGVLWNGKYFVLPQAASRVDSSAVTPVQLGSANRVVLLGEMVGLIPPKVPLLASSPAEALSLIHPESEEARLAAKLLFNPGPGEPGASEVYLLAVNPSTPATKSLLDAGSAAALTLTTYIYGGIANAVRRKVEAGSVVGKKILISYLDTIEEHDNISLDCFTILYTGAGVSATMTIVPGTGLTTTVLDGGSQPIAADQLDIAFATYDTVEKVVALIDQHASYTVALVMANSDLFASTSLDAVAAQNIKSGTYHVHADLQACVDTINARSAYCSATRTGTKPPDNVDWSFFAGAVNGTPASSDDWQDAFTALQEDQYDILLLLTSDATIHGYGAAHCDYMSSSEGKSERRQFVGGALNTWTSSVTRASSVAALKAESIALGNDRTYHGTLGTEHYNESGVKTLYPSYITAAMYAGIAAGGSPVKPLTRKFLNCLGVEVKLTKGEIKTLLDGRLMPPIADPVRGGGFCISRQLSTWQIDENLYRIEFSVGRGADYIAAQVRRQHEDLVGKEGSEAMDAVALNITNATLQRALEDGYIRSYDPKKTTLRVIGTARYIDYSAQPILPINWVFSTYHLDPVDFTISL